MSVLQRGNFSCWACCGGYFPPGCAFGRDRRLPPAGIASDPSHERHPRPPLALRPTRGRPWAERPPRASVIARLRGGGGQCRAARARWAKALPARCRGRFQGLPSTTPSAASGLPSDEFMRYDAGAFGTTAGRRAGVVAARAGRGQIPILTRTCSSRRQPWAAPLAPVSRSCARAPGIGGGAPFPTRRPFATITDPYRILDVDGVKVAVLGSLRGTSSRS